MYIDTHYTPDHRGLGDMAKRPGAWAYGCAIGLIGAGVAASSGCENTQFVDEGIPFSTMPGDMAEAMCTSVEDCFFNNSLVARDQCEKRLGPTLVDGWGTAVGAGIDEGRIQYIAQSAQGCLNDLAACGRDQQLPASCYNTFLGQVPLGDDCLQSFDCEGDAYCVADAVCPGVCTAWGGTGAACRNDGGCDRNLRCVGAKCTATGTENAPCTSDMDCNYSLLCLSVDGAGKCVEVADYLTAGEDEACGTFAADIPADPLCEREFVCAQDSADSTTGTCKQRVGAGEDCSLAFLSQCPQGYSCPATPGVCTVLPTTGACAELYGDRICQAGSACISSSCVVQKANGSDCTVGADCESESCLSGKCGPLFVCDPPPDE